MSATIKEAYGVPQDALIRAGYIPKEIDAVTQYHYYPFKSVVDIKNFLQFASAQGEYRPRGEALESDQTFGQLAFYAYELRPDGRFFLYQRGREGYDESRLAGQVSVGIGGHMERTDLSLARSFKREFAEEAVVDNGDAIIQLLVDKKPDLAAIRNHYYIQPRGLLKHIKREVDRVHIGVVTRLIPRDPKLSLRIIENGENVASQYVSLEEYRNMVQLGQVDPEAWTDAVIREEIEPLLAASRQ